MSGRWKGTCFIYDGINSKDMNVRIGNLDGSAIAESNILGTYESYIDKTNQSNIFNSLGGTYTEPPRNEFKIIVSNSNLTTEKISEIHHWLFNRESFLPLEILQNDMQGYVYYCKLLNPVRTYIGGYGVEWKCTLECNSPYAWKKDGKSYIITNSNLIVITNISMEGKYIYPNIEIKSSINGGKIKINNNTLNEHFEISNLYQNEIININKFHSIKSSLGTNVMRLKDTNLKFPRLIRGNNEIMATGNFQYVKISFDEAVKVGG